MVTCFPQPGEEAALRFGEIHIQWAGLMSPRGKQETAYKGGLVEFGGSKKHQPDYNLSLEKGTLINQTVSLLDKE